MPKSETELLRQDASADTAPVLTIAVINHQLRGYPLECLESIGAGAPRPDTEVLLIDGAAANSAAGVAEKFPAVRVIPLSHGDRATAKNFALAEARGALAPGCDTCAKV